jgi:siroheme synthase (precorrin-2 oxidase/ferrochelatase)
MNAVVAIVGEGDLVAKITELNSPAKANAAAAREKVITDLVGAKLNEYQTENKRYTYVQKITAGLEGEKFNSALAALKDDTILAALAGAAADMDSPVNAVASTRKVNAADFDGASVTL